METVNYIFGLYDDKLNVGHMALRAVLVFFCSLLLIRVSGIRTLGRQSSFDQLTAFILGSILGRIIVTGGNFFGGLVAALVIMLCHRFISWLTFKSSRMGKIFKGEPLLLMDFGQPIAANLKRAHITQDDLNEALHKHLNTGSWVNVDKVYLERSGEMGFIKKEQK